MKYLLTLFIIAGIIGCKSDAPEGYSISGEIVGIEDGKYIYVSQLGQNNQPEMVDSVAVEDEKFFLDLPEVENPVLNFINIKGYNGNVMFISENEPLKIEVYKDSLKTSKVSGGEENRVFYEYLAHLKELNEEVIQMRMEMREQMTQSPDMELMAQFQEREEELMESDMSFKKKMIRENPNAYVSLLVLTDMQSMGASTSEVKEYYELISDKLKQTELAKNLKTELDKRSAVEIGSKAPEFSGPNPDGEELALSELLGKVTLIDFWAAWCKPCRVENPNIVRVYEKYHDQGFNIVGVSLDREDQRERWLQAIKEDNLTWPQISNLQYWQEPIAQLYGVRAIPAAFLLDENGVIVARDLRGENLENKVKEMLGQ